MYDSQKQRKHTAMYSNLTGCCTFLDACRASGRDRPGGNQQQPDRLLYIFGGERKKMEVPALREQLLRDESVQQAIATRAYEIYVSRGYQDGRDIEDWFQAEHEVIERLVNQLNQERTTDGQPVQEQEAQPEPVAAQAAMPEIAAEASAQSPPVATAPVEIPVTVEEAPAKKPRKPRAKKTASATEEETGQAKAKRASSSSRKTGGTTTRSKRTKKEAIASEQPPS